MLPTRVGMIRQYGAPHRAPMRAPYTRRDDPELVKHLLVDVACSLHA